MRDLQQYFKIWPPALILVFLASLLVSCAGIAPKLAALRWPAGLPVEKILPLGDSNTYGYFPNGYRKHLAELLTNRGIRFEFVGSQIDERDLSFAGNRHEGHVGWGIDDLLNGLSGVSALESISKFKPSVILLMAGTNDIGWKRHSIEQAESDFHSLLLKIRLLAPNARIVVATILPSVDIKLVPPALSSQDHLNKDFNRWLGVEIAAQSKADKNLSLVDIGAQIPIAHSIDGIHANEQGYIEMAEIWNRGLSFL